mmetsp:Transcript_64562/g.151741  ORF Transcript_64562/g.151741 Transcript_64562/m.151741 type:complete len:86 (-) Transcript_64562:215-472(-)
MVGHRRRRFGVAFTMAGPAMTLMARSMIAMPVSSTGKLAGRAPKRTGAVKLSAEDARSWSEYGHRQFWPGADGPHVDVLPSSDGF